MQDQDENFPGSLQADAQSLPDHRPVYCPKENCTTHKNFGSYQALQRHLDSVHLNNDLFWCHICGETGPVTLGGIQYHVTACHRDDDPQLIMAKIEENLRARGGVDYSIPEAGGPASRFGVGVSAAPSACTE